MVQVERKKSKGLWIREMMTKEWAEYMNLRMCPWTMKISCNLTVHLIATINLGKDGYYCICDLKYTSLAKLSAKTWNIQGSACEKKYVRA